MWEEIDDVHDLSRALLQTVSSSGFDAPSRLCISVFVLRGIGRCLSGKSAQLTDSSRQTLIKVRCDDVISSTVCLLCFEPCSCSFQALFLSIDMVDSNPELKEITNEAAAMLEACFGTLYATATAKFDVLQQLISSVLRNEKRLGAHLALEAVLDAFALLSDADFPQVSSIIPMSSKLLASCFQSAVVPSPGDEEGHAVPTNIMDDLLMLISRDGAVSDNTRSRLLALLDRVYRIDWDRSNWMNSVFPLCEVVCRQPPLAVSSPCVDWNTYSVSVVDGYSLSICAVGFVCPRGYHSASLYLVRVDDPSRPVQEATASWVQTDRNIAPVRD